VKLRSPRLIALIEKHGFAHISTWMIHGRSAMHDFR